MELSPICGLPSTCHKKDVDHALDLGMTVHGSLEAPLPVDEPREERFVEWEYGYIGVRIVPFNRCCQTLFGDTEPLGRRRIDRIVVRDSAGRHHAFYFEITSQMTERNDKMERLYKDWKAGKKIPRDIEKILLKSEEIHKKGLRQVDL
jgi:hypothetical protein